MLQADSNHNRWELASQTAAATSNSCCPSIPSDQFFSIPDASYHQHIRPSGQLPKTPTSLPAAPSRQPAYSQRPQVVPFPLPAAPTLPAAKNFHFSSQLPCTQQRSGFHQPPIPTSNPAAILPNSSTHISDPNSQPLHDARWPAQVLRTAASSCVQRPTAVHSGW
ncbi:hypothetical protein MRB53_030430 [Persea americana]|uniref:Uncharacterized protein n=1 Tax=Persea americana TaxID=3435 RepID=A0ACC2KL98_PERAE|nr:hypothetical protein MRB53_030430 [Persea americana]